MELLTENGSIKVSRTVYYDRKYWRPDRYFEWTDAVWQAEPVGEVEVGPLRAGESE